MSSSLPTKTRFVIRLVRCLHQYGASSYRLESAVAAVSRDLHLSCDLFSGPTSCFLTIRDEEDLEDAQLTTRVLRLEPGAINLARLSLADEIAERVSAGTLSPEEGSAQLAGIEQVIPNPPAWRSILASVATSVGIAILLAKTWWDVLAAAITGLVIGLLCAFPGGLDRQGGLEAVAATIAALMAHLFMGLFPGLTIQIVIIAGLINLMPGLSLTTAMAELANNHLVSGTARLAGASMTLLKLTFGVVLGSFLASKLGINAKVGAHVQIASYFLWPALLAASWGSAYVFRIRRRDLPISICAAIIGYLIAKYSGVSLGPELGIFIAGLIVASSANIYARAFNRPASLVRLPGIILLVPGSMGFRGVVSMFQGDAATSMATAFSAVVILVCLVAGLLFGNVLVTPRRDI